MVGAIRLSFVQLGGLAPRRRQIFPCRILSFDQGDLLLSPPAFQLFLPSDRGLYPLEFFVVNEAMNLVVGSKSAINTFAVFSDSDAKITCDPDV